MKDIYDSILVVPIDQVSPLRSGSDLANSLVNKVKGYLTNQGQIEPMQVKVLGKDQYATFERDPWSDYRIEAARQLNWPTLLVCPCRKYED